MGEVGFRREYGRRRRTSGRRFGFIVMCLGNALFQLTRDHHVMPWRVRAAPIALALTILGWAALLHWRGRTVAGPDGITAYGPLRARRFAWPDVYDLRIEPGPAQRTDGPRWFAYLYRDDGRRTRLPFLDDWQLPGLYGLRTEVGALREAAALRRGAAWERRPEVEQRIRRRAAHHKAWQRAVTGAVVVLLVMLLVLFTEALSGTTLRPVLLLVCVPAASFTLLAALLHWRWESQVPRHLREP
ncbi:PH domain-containing protein [Streptomyces sp. NPDC002888]|uniref:PH domain-containing protein n=1 Tax=Streptomyces sp. NPDC002888 TaxID=3364668 RepID=UPI0036B3020B